MTLDEILAALAEIEDLDEGVLSSIQTAFADLETARSELANAQAQTNALESAMLELAVRAELSQYALADGAAEDAILLLNVQHPDALGISDDYQVVGVQETIASVLESRPHWFVQAQVEATEQEPPPTEPVEGAPEPGDLNGQEAKPAATAGQPVRLRKNLPSPIAKKISKPKINPDPDTVHIGL